MKTLARYLPALLVFSLCLIHAHIVSAEDEKEIEPREVPVFREAESLVKVYKEGMQERILDRWHQILTKDANLAAVRNSTNLYPNPSLQAYVNRLGQSLIPEEVADSELLSFRIVNDPLPYADALATGTVYVSTGLLSLLDNESQLAFVLMQEASHITLAHHMQQAILDEESEKKARKLKIAGSAVGVLTAGLLDGGEMLLGMGGVYGFKGGAKGAEIAGRFRNRKYLKGFQHESDAYAASLILRQGFDVREAPTLMAKIEDVLEKSNASVAVAFGGGIDLPVRMDRIREWTEEQFSEAIQRILNTEGFRVASPRFSHLMAFLKRDNGRLALSQDLFVIAKLNLEESAAIHDNDPVTMLALGELYRTTARTDADRERAASYLRSAMESDGLRHRHPESYLQLAVELLSRNDPSLFGESATALKTYVALYQRRSGGSLPPEMQFIYDSLERTGESNWIAYEVDNMTMDAPYQMTGIPEMDEPNALGTAE